LTCEGTLDPCLCSDNVPIRVSSLLGTSAFLPWPLLVSCVAYLSLWYSLSINFMFPLSAVFHVILVRGGAKKQPTCLHLRFIIVNGCWPTLVCSISRLWNIMWVRGPLGLSFALKTKHSMLHANDCQSHLVVS